jgi:hypothetical protein
MTKVELVNKVTRTFNKGMFQLKKHSPEILVIGGVVGTVVAGVMACRATTKVHDILEKAKTNVDEIHEMENEPKYKEIYKKETGEEFTETVAKRELAGVYVRTGMELIKVYAPAVAVGAVSITAILAGNNILRQRAVAYAAAFTATENSFKEYRERVVNRFGKELDKELRYNIKTKEVEETVVQEDGTETTVTKTVQEINPSQYDQYTRCFDETCKAWTRNAELNLAFLMQTQNYLNDRLRSRGYLSLNDAYEALGFQQTGIGQIKGWVYDPSNPDLQNHVDLGIHDLYNEQKRAFVNGYEKSIWITFNVDHGDLNELMA